MRVLQDWTEPCEPERAPRRKVRLLLTMGTLLLVANAAACVIFLLPMRNSYALRIELFDAELQSTEKRLADAQREAQVRETVLNARIANLASAASHRSSAPSLQTTALEAASPPPEAASPPLEAASSPGDEALPARAAEITWQCNLHLCRTSSCCGFSDPMRECGGCNSSCVCRPGAACSERSQGNPSGDAGATQAAQPIQSAQRTQAELVALTESAQAFTPVAGQGCEQLVEHGFCLVARLASVLRRFCGDMVCAEERSSTSSRRPLPDSSANGRAWLQQSIFDTRSKNASWCASAAALASLEGVDGEGVDSSAKCGRMEDESELPQRGFYVARGVLSEAELEAIRAQIATIPQASRMLCGVAGVQPSECMVSSLDFEQGPWAPVNRWVRQTLARWMTSGLAQKAELGWPLTAAAGEVITINGWGLKQNVSCLFQSLFHAVSALPANGIAECLANYSCPPKRSRDATSFCWLRCAWNAVSTRLPLERVRSIVAQGKLRASCEAPPRGSQLGSFVEDEPAEGLYGHRFFDVPAPRQYSYRRVVSEMRTWLTKVTGEPLCQGYHDWHMDGPHTYGRSHKMFVMISKSKSGTGAHAYSTPQTSSSQSAAERRHMRQHTNLRLLPVMLRYAHNCELELGSRGTGVWPQLDAHSCVAEMEPGDVLFFREDVWHRTQDALYDRNALIVDIHRFPMASAARELSEASVTSAVTNKKGAELFQGVLNDGTAWGGDLAQT